MAYAIKQGKTKNVGHFLDGVSPFSDKRINKCGNFGGDVAENISYGPKTGEAITISYIIDDGNPSRGHRNTIYSTELSLMGSGSAPNIDWGIESVQDFAKTYTPNGHCSLGATSGGALGVQPASQPTYTHYVQPAYTKPAAQPTYTKPAATHPSYAVPSTEQKFPMYWITDYVCYQGETLNQYVIAAEQPDSRSCAGPEIRNQGGKIGTCAKNGYNQSDGTV